MKRSILIIILAVFCFSTYAESSETIEDSASYYYLKGEYGNSLDLYLSLEAQNYNSSELFFNIGNCYYKTGDIANSIYFYEKALVLAPNDADIIHNLDIANTKVKSKVEQLPTAFYNKWFFSAISIMSSDAWAITGILCFILALSSILIYLFSKRTLYRKITFTVGVFSLLLAGLSIIFSVNLANRITQNNFAIVFESSLVKSSPNEESNNLFEIDKGMKIEINDSIDSWYSIKLADGKQGWIMADNIKRI